jgi:type II secretory pathway pseudopilin PulG
MRQVGKKRFRLFRKQRGIGLIDTLVALCIIGAITVAFLNGLITSSKASFIADERTTAESLATSQMEWVMSIGYIKEATQYSPGPIPADSDYANYSAVITAQPLHNPDDGLQKITVVVKHYTKTIITLESYKRQK